jgi:Zn-dependent protease
VKWSVRLGSPFGIPVYLHLTFLLLLGFLGLGEWARGGIAAGLASVVMISAVFGVVVLHELGHALAARGFGIATRDVTLYPIGGVARLERMPRDPRQEMWIALAGPAVNLGIAGLLGVWLALTGFAGGVGFAGGSFAARLMAINLGLVVFNMLPAFPMDGGRVLRAVLARRVGHLAATEIAATVGKSMAVLFGIAGIFWNPMLLFIAIFVWFGAGQEVMAARMPSWVGEPGPFAPSPPVVRVWVRRWP